MAVAFDAASESHTSTTGSTSQSAFSWTHTPSGTPKGVLVFVTTDSTTDTTSRVIYGSLDLVPVSGGLATDSAGETGTCKAWLLSRHNSVAPTGVWSAASSPGFGGNIINSVAYGNGTWVAGGNSGSLRYATDPTGTWSAASSPGFSTSNINSVAYGNGTWVAAGAAGNLRYATDPTGTWSAASSPGFDTNSNIDSVAYGNGTWVAGNASGSLRYATDPTGTWSAASSPGFGTNLIRSVAYGNGTWVAGGFVGNLRYGFDGISNVESGARTVTIVRTNNADEMYAVAITVTADYGVEATGVVLLEGDGTLAEQNVDDGSPGTNSVRFAAINSGLADVPAAGANSTAVHSIDFGTRTAGVVRETTAGAGSRAVGFSSASSDDRAAVHLAIREAIVPWTVGIPIR